MRTTIDLRDDQRETLAAMAARRGLRGYSALIQEAVDLLLQRHRDQRLEVVLSLEGSLTTDEADALEAIASETRSQTWRTFS